MGRDSHLQRVLSAWGKDGKLMEKVNTAKILVVGAGGIGCELLKVMAAASPRAASLHVDYPFSHRIPRLCTSNTLSLPIHRTRLAEMGARDMPCVAGLYDEALTSFPSTFAQVLGAVWLQRY